MNENDTQNQSAQKAVERATIRLVQVRNGYIFKTNLGQFVYPNLEDALDAVEDFFSKGSASGGAQ